MSRLVLLMTAVTMFSSCNWKDLVGPNIKKGATAIVTLYGGNCAYSVGTGASTKEESGKYLELDLKNSKSLDEFQQMAYLPASNMAYTMYHNLNAQERTHYSYINTVLNFSDGSKLERKYSTLLLDTVLEKMEYVDHAIELIKTQRYEELGALIDTKYITPAEIDTFVRGMIYVDSTFGKATDFILLGFSRGRQEELDIEYLKISGSIKCEKENHQFSCMFDVRDKKNRLISVAYKL